MKKAYKDLRKNLKNSFTKIDNRDYDTKANVEYWILQHCKKLTEDHYNIVCKIMGSVPYPYQKEDRKKILKYLKKNKKLIKL